jgi:3-oxoacyl-[acyl-carrier-protein] synthase III
MRHEVFIAGVGMIPFVKPGSNDPYPKMAADATHAALLDARIGFESVQQAYVGYVYGDSTAGQRALYDVGMTGIPIINVNNNCATGSTALFLARQTVESGAAHCVLALGFEHMSPGALGAVFKDRPSPFDRFDETTAELVGHGEIPLALRYFGGAGLAHMQQYGTELSNLRQDSRQGEPARCAQSHGTIPQSAHRRRSTRLSDDVARGHDATDGLPADLRRGSRNPLFGRVRAASCARASRAHQGTGHDH